MEELPDSFAAGRKKQECIGEFQDALAGFFEALPRTGAEVPGLPTWRIGVIGFSEGRRPAALPVIGITAAMLLTGSRPTLTVKEA